MKLFCMFIQRKNTFEVPGTYDLFIVCRFLNIWGHMAMVHACIYGTLTTVQPHWNAMPQRQDMTPIPVTVYRHGPNLSFFVDWCWKFHWKLQIPTLMSWIKPDHEILSRPSTHKANNPFQWYCYSFHWETR